MLSALAHSMLRDHVSLWITFVFCSNTCVSLNITKTSPQHHATLHAFAVHDLYSLSIARTCTIARMSPFSGQCERLSRRLVINNISRTKTGCQTFIESDLDEFIFNLCYHP
jgi:hypothetical protein